MVARHHDPLVRHEYAVVISRKTGVELRMVDEAIGAAVRHRRAEVSQPAQTRRSKLSGTEKAERELLRLVMTNSAELRAHEIGEDLFLDDAYQAAFVHIWPEIEKLGPGEVPDLGRIVGSGDSDESRLLAELALEDRPESDPGDVINRLKVGAVTRRIEQLQRELENLADDDHGYSDKFEELLALQQQKQRLRSRE